MRVEDAQLRMADLAQLELIAANYGSLEKFLTELTLDWPEATSGRAKTESLFRERSLIVS
jgi:DNA helicase-2/ATP-dependent DNA helicase PcrA